MFTAVVFQGRLGTFVKPQRIDGYRGIVISRATQPYAIRIAAADMPVLVCMTYITEAAADGRRPLGWRPIRLRMREFGQELTESADVRF